MLIVGHRTTRVHIVQLYAPVAHRPTNPGIHFIDFIVNAAACRYAGVFITVTSRNIETVIKAVLRMQIRFVD